MKKLLTDILNRLKAIVASIKYIDEDWGQFDYYSPNMPVQFPAVLIDASRATYTNEGKLIQLGDVQIRLRIADLRLTNTSGNAPQTQKDAAFAIFDTLAAIHKALHGWAGSMHYTKLIRVSSQRILRDDGVRIYEIIYTTRLTDAGAVPEQTVHIVTPDVNVTRL